MRIVTFIKVLLRVWVGMIICPIIIAMYVITGAFMGALRGCLSMYEYFSDLQVSFKSEERKAVNMRYDEFVEKVKLRLESCPLPVTVKWISCGVTIAFPDTGTEIVLCPHHKPCKLWFRRGGASREIEWVQLSGILNDGGMTNV